MSADNWILEELRDRFQFSPSAVHVLDLGCRIAALRTTGLLSTTVLLLALEQAGREKQDQSSTDVLARLLQEALGERRAGFYQAVLKTSPELAAQKIAETPLGKCALTPNVVWLVQRAKEIAIATTGEERIHSRHLVAALLSAPTPGRDFYVHRRLRGFGVSVQDICRQYGAWVASLEPNAGWEQVFGNDYGEPSETTFAPVAPPTAEGAAHRPQSPEPGSESGSAVSISTTQVVVRTATQAPRLRLIDDAPIDAAEHDALGFAVYAEALAGVIDDPSTGTPITIAINAPWGAGKSSLGKMIKKILDGKDAAGGSRPHITCWFDAWMYDEASNLSASLVAEVARAAYNHRPWWRRLVQPVPASILYPEDLKKQRLLTNSVLVAATFSLAWALTSYLRHNPTLVQYREWLALKVGQLIQDLRASAGADKTGLSSASPSAPPTVPTGYAAVLISAMAPLGAALKAVEAGIKAAFPAGQAVASYVANPRQAGGKESMRQVRSQLQTLIEQALPKGSRFVLFIDDLDRCRPPRSVDLLETVNQLLGPSVVTVLMTDIAAVATCVGVKYQRLAAIPTARVRVALTNQEASEAQRAYGQLYLQKIIKLQFDLPPHSRDQMARLARRFADDSADSAAASTPPRAAGNRASAVRVLRDDQVKTLISLLAAAVPLLASSIGAAVELTVPIALVGGVIVRYGIGEVYKILLRRTRDEVDTAIRQASTDVDQNSQPITTEDIRKQLKSGVDESIVQERLQIHVTHDAGLVEQACAEMWTFLPGSPRHAKRLLNQLRVMLFIAYRRGMLTVDGGVVPAHIGKWVVLRERWPQLAAVIHHEPNLMRQLEAASGVELQEILRERLPSFDEYPDLRLWLDTPTKLGPVILRLPTFMPLTAEGEN